MVVNARHGHASLTIYRRSLFQQQIASAEMRAERGTRASRQREAGGPGEADAVVRHSPLFAVHTSLPLQCR